MKKEKNGWLVLLGPIIFVIGVFAFATYFTKIKTIPKHKYQSGQEIKFKADTNLTGIIAYQRIEDRTYYVRYFDNNGLSHLKCFNESELQDVN